MLSLLAFNSRLTKDVGMIPSMMVTAALPLDSMSIMGLPVLPLCVMASRASTTKSVAMTEMQSHIALDIILVMMHVNNPNGGRFAFERLPRLSDELRQGPHP